VKTANGINAALKNGGLEMRGGSGNEATHHRRQKLKSMAA
jgi:hypothetical protein